MCIRDRGLGVNGDFYIDTNAESIYGPKLSGNWGSATSLIGSAGADGSDGDDGLTVRSGSGAPASGLGVDGDWYIDTSANTIYGPKLSGNWGSSTSLVGPTGATGPAGNFGGASFEYEWDTSLSAGDPGGGRIRGDDAAQNTIEALRLDDTAVSYTHLTLPPTPYV